MILHVSYDDTARTVTTYDETGAVASARPYTAAENAQADRAIADAAIEQVSATLAADTKTDKTKIEAAIDKLATLLGDATTTGSIRQILGTPTDPAGTTSLRALKAQTNTSVASAASIKATLGFVIDLGQAMIDDAQATRRIARQTLRLARLQTGDFASADVGTDLGPA